MGEKLLLGFIILAVLIVGYIFFGGKKSKKAKAKQEPKQEKKVEQAVKTDKPKQEEKKEEAVPVVKMPEADPQKGFRIIRKKSEVKINKKALKSGSRNPSVSKVFDKSGKKIDEPQKDEIPESELEMRKSIIDLSKKEPGRFGTREIDYDVVNNGAEFKINNPEGSLNRAPRIGDRTNFGSHLNVSADGNLSGVVGTGISKTLSNIDKQTRSVDDNTEAMIRNVKRNFLGIEEEINPFDVFNTRRPQESQKKESALNKIDAKTLVLVDAINNPRFKRNSNKK